MLDIQRLGALSGGSYSDAVVIPAGEIRWIHLAGQTPKPPITGDLEGQSEQVFDQLAELLGRLGADLSHLVQITVYLTDLTQYPSFAAVRARRLGDHLPVSAAVGVAALLDDALVEVSAVAVAPAHS